MGQSCSGQTCSAYSGPRVNRYEYAPASLALEGNLAFQGCENRVILSDANISAGVPLGATLPENNVPRYDVFTTEFFDAKTATL
jgi:hypothetical protein